MIRKFAIIIESDDNVTAEEVVRLVDSAIENSTGSICYVRDMEYVCDVAEDDL